MDPLGYRLKICIANYSCDRNRKCSKSSNGEKKSVNFAVDFFRVRQNAPLNIHWTEALVKVALIVLS